MQSIKAKIIKLGAQGLKDAIVLDRRSYIGILANIRKNLKAEFPGDDILIYIEYR